MPTSSPLDFIALNDARFTAQLISDRVLQPIEASAGPRSIFYRAYIKDGAASLDKGEAASGARRKAITPVGAVAAAKAPEARRRVWAVPAGT